MRISDWSSDVCSSDLPADRACHARGDGAVAAGRRAALRRGDCQRYARPGGARSGGIGMLSRRGGRAMSLSLEAVDVFYGDAQALNGVSLAVPAGAIVALIGSNGAEIGRAPVSTPVTNAHPVYRLQLTQKKTKPI